MKPTQFLDAFRNIEKRIVSFLSIAITIIMGVGGLLCISFADYSLIQYSSNYYLEHHYKDFEIISSMGISDDNIQKLAALDGVLDAEGFFVMDGNIRVRNVSGMLTLLSVTDRISTPELLDGSLPETDTECALTPSMMEKYGLSIGDQVTLAPEQSDMEKILKERTFTVTGTFVHPDYTTLSINNIALLSKAAFDMEALSDGYLRALIYLDLDDDVRSLGKDDYTPIAQSMEERIRDYAEQLSRERSEEISSKAWGEYDKKEEDAQDQLDEGFKKLKDAEQELYSKESDAKTKLAGAFEDLTGSELKFSDGLKQTLQGEQQYQDGIAQIESARAQLAAGRAQLDQGYAQYQQFAAIGSMFSFLLGGFDPLASARAQLAAGEARYQQGVAALNQKIADADLPGASARIDASWEKLKQGREELDDAWLSYEEQRQEADIKIKDGYEKYENGKAEYIEKKTEAEEKLEDGRRQIESIEESRFLVTNRRTNVGYMEFTASIKSIRGFEAVFIPMFALVGCLVIYSTMAIIIDEQKKQVGALKAMGFRSGEIRNKYLIFGCSATLLGIIFGILLSILLERVILQTISSRYVIGALRSLFHPVAAAAVCLCTLLVAFIVVWISCRNLLKSTAVGLMNGSEPAKRTLKKSSGRDRSLYSHLIFSNIVTELPRVTVSVVVIIASCLLIGIGFAMSLAFNTAFSKQENEIYLYDLRITIDDDADDETRNRQRAAMQKLMKEHHITFLPILYKAASYETENDSAGFFYICGDENALRTFYETSVDIPSSGILVPEKFMESHVFSDDQTMTIYDSKLIPHEAKVSGAYPFHVGDIAIMSPSAYQEIFGYAPEYNGYYCSGSEKDIRELKDALSKTMPTADLQDKASFAESYETTRNLFNMVALIMVIIAGIITFMIIMNLNSILVNRRMKELLIMKVNGFANKQVIGYLLRETIVVNLAGIALGVAAGVFMNYGLIKGIEPIVVMYIRSPLALSWGGAALMNMIFAAIINTISFRKVGKIALTDITKY